MFARIVEFTPKAEMRDELLKKIGKEVLPILKTERGFLEILPLLPEDKADEVVVISLWTEKRYAERYERETYAKVEAILKPFLVTPVIFKHYKVETTLCEHFAEALAA
jgi:quinol monooxygenase YgiN